MLTSLKLASRPSWLLSYSTGYLCSFFLTFAVNAVEMKNESLQVHGFLAQGVIDANNSNYINADEDVSLELTEIGLNASYQLNDDFRIAGQAVYLNGGNRYHEGVRLDYFLIDWDAYHNEHWQANIYLGRFKSNHWLYSGTRDVPFVRPSIILPQSVYIDGFRDISVGGDGVAIKLTYSDSIVGEFDFNISSGGSAISSDQARVIIGDVAQGEVELDADMQASIYWRPLLSQWQFGMSALDSSFNYQQADTDYFKDGDFIFQFYTANALYEGEYWEFNAEIYQARFATEGFYSPGFHRDEMGQGYYIQTRYQLTQKTKLIMRHEKFYANKEDKNGSKLAQNTGGLIASYFGFHNDNMVGLSYDFSSDFRLNAEYHWMQGGARLSPLVQPDPIANDSEYWQVWAIQFMYWF
jgi:hypothetical protein